MRWVPVRSVALTAVLLAFVASPPGRPADPPRPETAIRFHSDARRIVDSVVETTLALLRDDAGTARRALDRMEDECARVSVDDDPSVSPEMAAFDLGFHRQLDAARELALRGDVEGTAQGFAWLQRVCRECHRQAEAEGVKPPRAPRETEKGQEPQSRG